VGGLGRLVPHAGGNAEVRRGQAGGAPQPAGHRGRREVWRVVAGHGEDQGVTPPVRLEPGMTHVVEVGAVHRLANTGLEPLVVVELQTGQCSEDDIERLADDYQRA
jgi:mannose-6-phosphate isomerase-like protein (cupin superfamily)